MSTLSLQKPTPGSLRAFLAAQSKLNFTYGSVGATATTPPAGFVVDRTRVKLGEGDSVFVAAKSALQRWEQFNLGWVEAWPRDTPIQPGACVAIMGHAVGLWWLNACRIIYVIDEPNAFGFAYGTLPGHAECGEERFLIEFNRADNSVHYDIIAFSKPNYLLTRLGYPFVRRLQKRFARDSAAAMLNAVRKISPL